MAKDNVGGIFFTEQENDFGKLFNEFNIYIRGLDRELALKEQNIHDLTDIPEADSTIQALDSYSAEDMDELRGHFRSLNRAFDSLEGRIQSALNRVLT